MEVNMYLREIGPLNLDRKVQTPFYTNSISKVCDSSQSNILQSFDIQVTLRQSFNDSRMGYYVSNNGPSLITLVGEDMDSVWLPDTFVRNERNVVFHDALRPNAYARVKPCGTIETSQRVTLELSCAKLKADLMESGEATCHMDLASCEFHHFHLISNINHALIVSF